MKIEKIKNLDCFCDFAHRAVIKPASGRFLGATCDHGWKHRQDIFSDRNFSRNCVRVFGGKLREREGLHFRLAEDENQ